MANSPDEKALIARLSTAFAPFLRGVIEPVGPEEDITNKRNRYLKALQANGAARAHFTELSHRNDTKSIGIQRDGPVISRASLRSHLDLLKLRRTQEKLSIIADHAGQLEHEVIDDRIFAIASTSSTHAVTSDDTLSPSALDLEELRQRVVTLTNNLELAVLRAKHELQKGKILLHQVKQRQSIQNGASHDDQNKLKALSASRDELVYWIEEHISADTSETKKPNDCNLPLHETEDSRSHRIVELYGDYIVARTRLLEVTFMAIASLPSIHTRSDVAGQQSEGRAISTSMSAQFLPFIETQLLGPHWQRDTNIAMQEFISSCLSQERARMLESLETLGDESHLLHLASNSKPATQNKATNFESPGNPRSSNEKGHDLVLQRVKAWKSAGSEARSLAIEEIESRVVEGEQSAERAETSLAALEEFLSQRREGLEIFMVEKR